MRETRYIRAISEALNEEMARDENVFIIGEDVGGPGGAFSATKGLLETYGERRVRDTPISESAIVGLAIGAAAQGLRPVAEIMFADFLTVCMDQIVNQMAKTRYMFGGMYKTAGGRPSPRRWWPQCRSSAFSMSGVLVCPHPGIEGCYAGDPIRCEGIAQVRDSR